MIFSITVYSAPMSDQSSITALNFAKALLALEHQLYRVFFYHDGVQHASGLAIAESTGLNLSEQWQQLANGHNIDLVVCVNSALKRGIIDQTEANRQGKEQYNLQANFHLSGLGQLLDAIEKSDRVVTFGH